MSSRIEQIIEEIAQKAKCRKEAIVYIGDSSVDMQTGVNAGVTTVGVSWGFGPRAELEAYHPASIADKSADIRSVLGIG